MKKILVLLFTSCMWGCATTPPPSPAPLPLVAQDKQVVIPQYLLLDCEPLSPLVATQPYNQGQSVDIVSTWNSEHNDCRDRFAKLRDITVKAFNIPIDATGHLLPTPASSSPTAPAATTNSKSN